MVAIALFAGFGSASAQEDEGVELTKDMFHISMPTCQTIITW